MTTGSCDLVSSQSGFNSHGPHRTRATRLHNRRGVAHIRTYLPRRPASSLCGLPKVSWISTIRRRRAQSLTQYPLTPLLSGKSMPYSSGYWGPTPTDPESRHTYVFVFLSHGCCGLRDSWEVGMGMRNQLKKVLFCRRLGSWKSVDPREPLPGMDVSTK